MALNIKTHKAIMQKILWEQAKGHLMGIVAVCRTCPVTDHCATIENKALDLILGMEAVVYDWPKKEKG